MDWWAPLVLLGWLGVVAGIHAAWARWPRLRPVFILAGIVAIGGLIVVAGKIPSSRLSPDW